VPRLGRTFVGPVFDTLWIGGGITIPAALWLLADGRGAAEILGTALPLLALLVNQAHFAASSLRLYTKPGAVAAHPFLAFALPLATLALLTLCIALSAQLGRHLWALAMTWSPYHYSAQAFGLASMYCYRSGFALEARERSLLRWACLMPFFRFLLGGAGSGLGLGWIAPPALLASPLVGAGMALGIEILDVLVFALPLLFFAVATRRARRGAAAGEPASGVPLLALFPVLANGTWFVLFDYWNAFVWATVLHGLQYLAVVAIFHARERGAAPGERRRALRSVAGLYFACVALGYALFQCWPFGYVLAGWGIVESTFLVVAVVNVHHFVVDAYIWRLRKDPNYGTVMAAARS
jgi:hypothetical protein